MSRAWPLFVAVTLFSGASVLAQPRPARNEAVHRLTEAAGAPVSVVVSPETGGVTFLTVPAGEGIPVGISPTAAADERALAFLSGHGEAFFIRGKSQLEVRKVAGPDVAGLEHVRLQQMHRGVPVTGGELIVHLRGDRVTAVSGLTLDDLDAVGVEPSVQAADAQETVRQLVGGKSQSVDVTVGEPRLEVFNRGLLEKRRYPTRLAWFVEARGLRVREFVWVDAQRGNVLLRFSQLPHAKSRVIHSSAGTPDVLPGVQIRSEGQAATGDLDGNAAYDFSGFAYDYFLVQHGRDSFDGIGGVIRSTVDFCQTGSPCPFVNAFWNGDQLVYGDQMSRADDVSAHEFTHAVTEYTANLFYYMQSGALNEAFSDIFGETVDLMTNPTAGDTAGVRWLGGEDLVPTGGAIRNMMNPNAFGDPGKMSDSAQFVCAQPGGDSGGVHSNSGILNHAYALMVDGGSFNGRTVTGIGLTKAGKVAYRALDSYLVSASGFLETYHAFRQACYDLIGTVAITQNDCWQVQTAMDAVELADPWPCPGTPARIPPLCPLGQAATNVFFDNLTAGGGNWGTELATVVGPNPWFLGNFYGTSEPIHLWGLDQDVTTHSRLVNAAPFVLPAGARLQFNHAYGFENDAGGFYDGAVLEYRNETGPGPWVDAAPLFTAGTGYDSAISSCCGNALAGRQAFAGHSFGYTASQYNLATLAGQNTRFAFRLATDSSFGDVGWVLDDIRVYTCGTPSDLIFADGFDAGNLTAWSAQNTGGGDLVANAPSALVGTPFGMQATVNDTTGLFVTDNTPNNEARYRARFYLDPNTFDPGEAGGRFRARVFLGFEDQGVSGLRRLFAVVLRRQGGQYALMGRARLDSDAQADTGFFNITNAPHTVEIELVKSNGSNNGAFEMWIDGVSVRRLSGLDNDLSAVDLARLGALSLKPGANGVLYFDHFDSRRVNYIGQ